MPYMNIVNSDKIVEVINHKLINELKKLNLLIGSNTTFNNLRQFVNIKLNESISISSLYFME